MPFGPESVYRDPADRPVDLPDGEAERQWSSQPGESSLAVVITPRSTITSGAKAATERSEGVAGAKRSRTPVNHPEGRALGASGSEPWAMPGGPLGKSDTSLLCIYMLFYTLSRCLVTLYNIPRPSSIW